MTTAKETAGLWRELREQRESLMITLELRILKAVPAALRPLYDRWIVANEEAMPLDSSEQAMALSRSLLGELLRALQAAGISTL